MVETASASPSVAVTSPEGASVPVSSPRRRGLNRLRSYTQNRPSGTSGTDNPRSSPRNFFARSASYTERPSATENSSRPRSTSRPDDSRIQLSNPRQQYLSLSGDERRLAPESGSRRTRSTSRSRRHPEQPSIVGEQSSASSTMARHRTSNAARAVLPEPTYSAEAQRFARLGADSSTDNTRTTRVSSAQDQQVPGDENSDSPDTKQQLPTIRFFPHHELRNGRQSLPFTPVARTLPSESSVIRIGRYSEREGIPTSNPTAPSDAPVGFKSKVVSRRHCEFTFVNGQWQIRDVSSSSGTFLNHIRLSQPNMESKLFPVKDGDIVQLGIDFRGGEEMIFRCVKIRIECNRSWQKKPNNFNMSRHAQLQSLGKTESTSQDNSGECVICLGAVLPCQSLFVAACAHVWHYKCIRPMLEGKNSSYPQFQCPNCRAWTDLSAEVDLAEEDLNEWMDNAGEIADNDDAPQSNGQQRLSSDGRIDEDTAHLGTTTDAVQDTSEGDLEPIAVDDNAELTYGNHPVTGSGLLARRQATNLASPDIAPVNGISMPNQLTPTRTNDTMADTSGPEGLGAAESIPGEGPLTPRNNAGPFVFDGSAGRLIGRRLVVPGVEVVPE